MVYLAQQAFGFGEVDPNIRAQYEAVPYQKGCQKLANTLLSATGSAEKRWGSVNDASYQAVAENSYQYVTGFGDRVMIYGGTTTYSICSANHPVQTFTGMILDVAYRGPDLILLTDKGLFRHEFSKSGTDYLSIRYAVEVTTTLLSSTPPVAMQYDARYTLSTLATKVTSGSGWFIAEDAGDVYKFGHRGLTTLAAGGTEVAPFPVSVGRFLSLDANGYVSPTEFNCTWNYHGGTSEAAGTEDIDTLDWSGPYRNWMGVGKVLSSLDVPGSPLSGVIYDAVIGTWVAPSGLNVQQPVQFSGSIHGNNYTDRAFCEQVDSDILSVLETGKVGKIVKTWNMGAGNPSVEQVENFVICAKQVYDDTTEHPMIWRSGVESQFNPSGSFAPIGWVEADGFTTQIFLASSDGVLADGLPAPKSGFFPTILARIRSEKTANTTEYEAVQLVGAPSSTVSITKTTPTFDSEGVLTSTSEASANYRQNVDIGEVYPLIDSRTFRISDWEVNNWASKIAISRPTNAAFQWTAGTTGYSGSSPYWTLTGRAYNNFGDTPSGDSQDVTPLTASSIEIHQERTFLAGFDADTPSLQVLPEAQDLGLTIISSKSNELTNFSAGSLPADSLSFIISSKAGGKISWLKSQFNQLFVGTTQEEYVIVDAPITGTDLNIQLQSSYGSEYLKEAVIFGNDIVFIPKGKRTIRAMSFEERRQRYETDDLFQFARHLIKGDTIERIEVVSTEIQRLFVRTGLGKVYCFTSIPGNQVYGWSEWSMSSDHTILDVVGTVDDSGNPALWGRTSATFASDAPLGLYFTPDSTRLDYHVDAGEDATTLTTTTAVISAPLVGETLSVIATFNNGSEVVTVYLGDVTPSTTTMTIPTLPNVPTKVVVGLPYDFELAPNIPELLIPGKGGSGVTLGRNKNITRIRILLNQARGAVVEGYSILPAPKTAEVTVVVAESPGFYSVPVIGEYGPQPTISIKQSVPYGFEVSGYNAEYEFGD